MDILEPIFRQIQNIIPKLPLIVFNLLVGMVIIKIITMLVRKAVKLLKIHHDLRGFIINAAKLISWTFLIIYTVSSLGFGSLAVMLSGSAVALAFILNNSAGSFLGDIFAGLSLISDPDFSVGMKVSINDGKTEGVIKEIDMRKVRILDNKDKIHVIPNSFIEKNEWVVIERKVK